jgi:hypothetical protein
MLEGNSLAIIDNRDIRLTVITEFDGDDVTAVPDRVRDQVPDYLPGARRVGKSRGRRPRYLDRIEVRIRTLTISERLGGEFVEIDDRGVDRDAPRIEVGRDEQILDQQS